MELFREDGCMTDAGFRAMMDGQLDELGRLEAAKHLSYCDQCMDRYTALLTADALEKPPKSVQGAVMGTIWARLMQNTYGGAAVAGVAAVLALTLWRSGASMVPGGRPCWRPTRASSGNPARMTRPRRTPRNTAPLRTTDRRPRRNSWGDPWRQNRTAAMLAKAPLCSTSCSRM